MPVFNKNCIIEFNNSFSSIELNGNPIFEGGFLFGPTGRFNKKDREEKQADNYYLEVKCSSTLNPTGVKLIKEGEIKSAIQDSDSFSFIIKNYSLEGKTSMFRGDLTILEELNESSSFKTILNRNSSEEYYLKSSNGKIGGVRYISTDTFNEKTFYRQLSFDQGQKIFGMEIEYTDGELSNMTPVIKDEVNNELFLTRDLEGEWNERDSYSLFVPVSIIDMDSKSTIDLFDLDIGISDGGSSSLGLNGKSGPTF